MTETQLLATFAADLNIDQCPSPAIAQAKRCVLETVGCPLGGSKTLLMQAATRALQR
jgi:2-methylcitrate dehydratase PrpD